MTADKREDEMPSEQQVVPVRLQKLLARAGAIRIEGRAACVAISLRPSKSCGA